MRIDELKKELDVLIVKHIQDPSLHHQIGSDRDCWYCEQYNTLLEQQEDMVGDFARLKKISPKHVSYKELYEVMLKDGSRYMVYGYSLDDVASVLKTSITNIVQDSIVPQKYWDTVYVEQQEGGLSTIKQLMTSKRSRIVASYEASTNKNVRQYCFNETPFEFLIYEKKRFELLERFAKPYEAIKTKKFNSTGRASIQTEYGALGVSPEEVLVKITKKLIVVLSQDEFYDNFSKEENLVWKTS